MNPNLMFWNNICHANSNPIQLNDQFIWKISVFERNYFIGPRDIKLPMFSHKIIVTSYWSRTNNRPATRGLALPLVRMSNSHYLIFSDYPYHGDLYSKAPDSDSQIFNFQSARFATFNIYIINITKNVKM